MRIAQRFSGGLIVAALLCPALAQAEWSWIWSAKSDADAVGFRRDFEVAGEVRKATLLVTCDNGARVSLNGVEVLVNRDWNSPSKADVTRQLRTGGNRLEADARNQGGVAGFLARLQVRTSAGEFTIETDAAWSARLTGQSEWQPAKEVGRYGDDPWGDPFGLGVGRPLVVQPKDIQVLPGFRVELLHVVPKLDEGSWVSLTVDPQGRLIACDQNGGLYRMTPSSVGSDEPGKIERLETKVGGAHGLLYAFDSLYVMVNEQGGRQGLWRLWDQDGDGQFDEEKLLRRIEGGGEHGPHAVVLGPDNALYVVCGNHTKLPQGLELSRAPRNWDEDQIIPRLWDANGHARGVLAPGGFICRTDPDGRTFELISNGYRNAYDFAFNYNGEIITYDSDMEWDAGLPWYRPTRICLATSGSEFGWRSGSGKWPSHYPDSLPALVDIGPGSPTGLESGRGTEFPAKYQDAIFANDWTYGTMYAIHLKPKGAGYEAEREEFLSAKPLPLTDLVVNPHDGALYFAIGGRRTQSAVYRVSYVGPESTAPAPLRRPTPEHITRLRMEYLHREGTGTEAIDLAWPQLGNRDRWIRFAARIAIERQPVNLWAQKALNEERPRALIEAAIALARTGAASHRTPLLERLNGIEFGALDEAGQLALIRAYQLAIIRLGQPEGESLGQTVARLDALFPAATPELNLELSKTLIALGSPTAVPKTLQLFLTARDEDVTYASDALLNRNTGYADAFTKASKSRPNQQQIAYAYVLRVAKAGWTPALRRSFFAWFPTTAAWQGGNSFRGFIETFRKEALANVADPAERQALDELSTRVPELPFAEYSPPKGPGRDYSVDDVVALAVDGWHDRDFASGRNLFHTMACASCHRFDGQGGSIGPDLTTASSRFSLRDLADSIIDPSKVISDQYGSEQIKLEDGSTLIGRAYEEGDRLYVVYDPRNPEEKEGAPLSSVKERRPYPVSFMPAGLLNALNADEVLDLLAYIQSGGDPRQPMFRQ